MRGALSALLALFVGTFAARAAAGAEASPPVSFALIVGVNRSVDVEASVLRYADDDAARYLELFGALGTRSQVLTRADANTTRLYPQLAAAALLPVRADFEKATAALAAEVAQARRSGTRTVLYFVYAGHGNLRDGRGYLALEDGRLDTRELEAQVMDRIGADQTHFIVDACYSYFLTLERGTGGVRRELHGFSLGGLATSKSVGLLLSTSSARESHEWSGVEAGVFSHEVRSGLYGAADADGDGQVSYREIAAFIHRANGTIASERFRPDVLAHPPQESDVLLDLRASAARIEVPPALGGHYFLEDGRGVRYADVHNSARQTAYLVRPGQAERLYLRASGADTEYVIPASTRVVSLSQLQAGPPRSRERGAASDAFDRLFALPFDQQAVQDFALVPWDRPAPARDRAAAGALPPWRLYTGVALLGLATAGAVGASAALVSANDLRATRDMTAAAQARADLDARINRRTLWSSVGFAVAGAAAASGLAVLLWPHATPPVEVSAAPGTALVNVRRTF
jgi:hypothetical protein